LTGSSGRKAIIALAHSTAPKKNVRAIVCRPKAYTGYDRLYLVYLRMRDSTNAAKIANQLRKIADEQDDVIITGRAKSLSILAETGDAQSDPTILPYEQFTRETDPVLAYRCLAQAMHLNPLYTTLEPSALEYTATLSGK
jgi:hypothetical protein